MYLLLLENYFRIGDRFEYDRKIYTYESIDTIYQYLDHELFKHLKGKDSDDFWHDDIADILDDNCGFFIYKFSSSGLNELIFESIDKKWSDFYKFCFSTSEKISLFNDFIKESKSKFPNLKKFDIDGFLVLMGRDSQSNDHLTINMSNDDDLWFHVKGVPGSHVLIRIKDKLPTQEVIKQVSEIAAKNSKAKGRVTVVYCKAKFVTKSSDMKPGQVNVDYKNSQEIEVEI